MSVKPVPDGFHSVTPFLVVKGASDFIDFLKRAFDAEEMHRSAQPDGTIMHAQVRIGDSIVMLCDAMGEWGPKPGNFYLYVNDTDSAYEKALRAGAVSVQEPQDQFYGDRNAGVKDAFDNQWWMARHVEDVSPEEMAKREEAMKQSHSG